MLPATLRAMNPTERLAAAAVGLATLLAAVSVAATPELVSRSSPILSSGWTEGVECQSDRSQTYTLYVPNVSEADFEGDRRWPVLLIFDPRGRSRMAAELFADGSDELGWLLLSSNDTRSDGPMEPNVRAVNALWGELRTRYPIDPRRIYAAGFSGGAMLAWDVGRTTGELAGVIASGGRFETKNYDQKLSFPSFGAVSTTDFNYLQMKRVHERLLDWGTPQRLEVFAGPHSWMPAVVARDGMLWLELMALKQKLRPSAPQLVEAAYAADLEAARELEEAGDVLAALRRFEALTATFADLLETTEAREQASSLRSSRALRAALASEEKWDEYDHAFFARMNRVLARIEREPEVSSAHLVAELGIKELHRRSGKGGYEAVVANRVLNTLATQTGFYLAQRFRARGDDGAVAKALEIATEARPERPWLWYGYAGALARTGSRKKAVEALESAMAAGYSNLEQLRNDPDFESLRELDSFRKLLSGG